MTPMRARFAARCLEDLGVLRDPQAETDERIGRLHRLAGTAGMLGFSDLGALAAELDGRLRAGEALTPEALAPLLAQLEAAEQPR